MPLGVVAKLREDAEAGAREAVVDGHGCCGPRTLVLACTGAASGVLPISRLPIGQRDLIRNVEIDDSDRETDVDVLHLAVDKIRHHPQADLFVELDQSRNKWRHDPGRELAVDDSEG